MERSGMGMESKGHRELRHVRYFYAPDDGRTVALYVSHDFDEYAAFPPFVETVAERAHIESAYEVANPESERWQKAHLTDDAWPLQVILLARDPGAYTKPHYHRNDGMPATPTRHELLLCQAGKAQVEVFTRTGDALGSVTLEPGDFVLCAEGHSLRILEAGTKVLEIKQGPFPGSDEADKVDFDTVG
jgi:hypothetical protein